MTRCDRCDASDALLFTCSHCDRSFCADHQFPHHACARFTGEGREWEEVGNGDVLAVPEPRTAGGPTASTTVPGPRIEGGRDAARETRPDREGPAPAPRGRGMPWERGDPSVTEWMREQTYPSYLAKVGVLSLLLTTAYYGGLAVVLYGYV